jgi:hypothetical protein
MGFDLRSIKTVDQFELPIKDQDGTPTGVTFVLAGPTHPVRKALDQAKSRKLINEANKHGRFKIPDPADAEATRPKDLAALTLGWSGYEAEGQQVPFSTEAAALLYADPELKWLADQVDEGLGNASLHTRRA